MFKAQFLLFVFLGLSLACHCNIDSLLNVLDEQIQLRPLRIQQKQEQINILRDALSNSSNQIDSFQLILQLTEAYQSFNYDTAKIEVQRLKNIADTPFQQVQAEIQEAFILLSSGLFREAIDLLNSLEAQELPDTVKSAYYFNLARSHFDLADTYSGYLDNEKVFNLGLDYLDKAIQYAAIHSVERLSYQGLKALKINEKQKSKRIYKELIGHPDISVRQLAIEYSALSSLYEGEHEDSLLIFRIKSAIADEQALVKESTALTFLAKYFSEQQHFERASRYINLALADANFFGAQHRKMQILDILPLIETQRLELEKSKYQQFVGFTFVLTILLLLSILLTIRTFRQKQQINHQNQQISNQNQLLQKSEADIRKAFVKLEEYAQKLSESNSLKEKYIGHFFQSNTDLINKIMGLFDQSIKQVHESKFKEAIFTLKQFNGTYQKNKLLQDFDSTFLTVFPTFIEQINQLFPEDHQFVIAEKNALTTELRIFALIRLGISNNNTIAKIHNYSVNTIYTYKTKIRNKSHLSNEDFDHAILQIKSIWDKPGRPID